MTESVTIRPYRPLDHSRCRALWAELAEADQQLYGEQANGDAGAGFEQYLTRLDLAGIWVAEHPEEGVVGLVGLALGGTVEPIVVSAGLRRRGIGRMLLDHVAGEARRRGLRRLSISPGLRNVGAIRCSHTAGYDTLASVTLALDLTGHGKPSGTGLNLHDLRFSY